MISCGACRLEFEQKMLIDCSMRGVLCQGREKIDKRFFAFLIQNDSDCGQSFDFFFV